ncbi:MAG: ATP-binding protein [Sulfurovum sp.]|nr:ATP-binding protein [Sulfurovum sp.]
MKKISKALDTTISITESAASIARHTNIPNMAYHGSKLLRMSLDSFEEEQVTRAEVLKDWSVLRSGFLFTTCFSASIAEHSEVVCVGNMVAHRNDFGTFLAYDRGVYCSAGVNARDTVATACSSLFTNVYKAVDLHQSSDDGVFNIVLAREDQKVLPSLSSAELSSRMLRYKALGENRSVFLHGPPGSGKSSVAFAAATSFGKKVLVVTSSKKSQESILAIVDALQPDCIVINDVEGVAVRPSTLDFFEQLGRRVSLVIATSNTINIDAALGRPGRFDEVIKVQFPEPELVDAIIGVTLRRIKPSKEVSEKIHKWPAAFIAELQKRVTALGDDCFSEAAEDLEQRVKKNKGTYA